MTQEESHPDQEGHADNRRRRQSSQVTEQGTPLSGRPAGLPARTRPCSPPTLIGVTADEHWVIPRAPTYALLLIANQRPTAPSPLRGGTTSDGGSPYLGRVAGHLPRPMNPPPGKRQEPGGTPEGAGAGRRAPRPSGPGTGQGPARVPAAGPPGVSAGGPSGVRPEGPPGARGPPGLPRGGRVRRRPDAGRGFRPEAGPAGGTPGRPPRGQTARTRRGNPAARADPELRPRHRPPWQDPRRSRRIRGPALRQRRLAGQVSRPIRAGRPGRPDPVAEGRRPRSNGPGGPAHGPG